MEGNGESLEIDLPTENMTKSTTAPSDSAAFHPFRTSSIFSASPFTKDACLDSRNGAIALSPSNTEVFRSRNVTLWPPRSRRSAAPYPMLREAPIAKIFMERVVDLE